MGFKSQSGAFSFFQHLPFPMRQRVPGLAPIGQITVAISRSCTAASVNVPSSSVETVLTVPADHLMGFMMWFHVFKAGDLLVAVGGDVSTFDHPLETPWSFSELDKPAHPPFKPGQQRQSGSTRVVEDSPSICIKVNV